MNTSKILIVEDSHIYRKVMASQLTGLGYGDKLTFANDGRQALAILENQQFDLIFMDCLMPELDGYQTTREIRCKPELISSVIIIAMTASSLESDRDLCLQCGMNDYICKPVKPEILKNVLLRWLTETDSPEAIATINPPTSDPFAKIKDLEYQENLIDFTKLDVVCSQDRQLEEELIHEFLIFAEQCLIDLHAAIVNKNQQQIAFQAHRLKGSAATVCIFDIPQWLTQIEDLNQQQQIEALEEILQRVAQKIEEVSCFFQHWCAV